MLFAILDAERVQCLVFGQLEQSHTFVVMMGLPVD